MSIKSKIFWSYKAKIPSKKITVAPYVVLVSAILQQHQQPLRSLNLKGTGLAGVKIKNGRSCLLLLLFTFDESWSHTVAPQPACLPSNPSVFCTAHRNQMQLSKTQKENDVRSKSKRRKEEKKINLDGRSWSRSCEPNEAAPRSSSCRRSPWITAQPRELPIAGWCAWKKFESIIISINK